MVASIDVHTMITIVGQSASQVIHPQMQMLYLFAYRVYCLRCIK